MTKQYQKLSQYEAKDIPGYEGLYAVTTCGKVYSHSKIVPTKGGGTQLRKGRWLKPETTNRGYLRVVLTKEGVQAKQSVHRLVAMAFLPNPENLPDVHHVNECKTDNKTCNLEWTSKQYNSAATNAKTYKLRNPEGEIIEVFNITKYAKDNDLSPTGMYEVATGKRDIYKNWTAIHLILEEYAKLKNVNV